MSGIHYNKSSDMLIANAFHEIFDSIEAMEIEKIRERRSGKSEWQQLKELVKSTNQATIKQEETFGLLN